MSESLVPYTSTPFFGCPRPNAVASHCEDSQTVECTPKYLAWQSVRLRDMSTEKIRGVWDENPQAPPHMHAVLEAGPHGTFEREFSWGKFCFSKKLSSSLQIYFACEDVIYYLQ